MYLIAILGALSFTFIAFKTASKPINPTEPPKTPLNAVKRVTASITKYRATGYPMANGKMPYIGAVAVSDRSIPLNSQIAIESEILSDSTKVFKVYDVKDRTALWVHEKHGLTIDIYTNGSKQEALQFGRQTKQIIFLTK